MDGRTADSQAITATPTRQARVALPHIGDLWLAWHEQALVTVGWVSDDEPPHPDVQLVHRAPTAYARVLRDYDGGKSTDPSTLPVDLRQGTPFQRMVWQALRGVRRGRVRTYAGIAADVDSPRAMRAVGMANGANPLTIVVPCHRIVAAGLQLGGYTGGLHRKRTLLELEGVRVEGDRLRPGQLDLF